MKIPHIDNYNKDQAGMSIFNRRVLAAISKKKKGVRYNIKDVRRAIDIHRSNGQIAPSSFETSLREGIWSNVPNELTPGLVADTFRKEQCLACQLARNKNLASA
jgi:hypothetical protein